MGNTQPIRSGEGSARNRMDVERVEPFDQFALPNQAAQPNPMSELGETAPLLVHHGTPPSLPVAPSPTPEIKIERPPELIRHDESQCRVRCEPDSSLWFPPYACKFQFEMIEGDRDIKDRCIALLRALQELFFQEKSLFPSRDRQLVSRLQDEIASLVNDITDLLVSCGCCSPVDIIELYGEQIPITIAKKPRLNPDQISFEAVVQGCKFIHYLLNKYWMDIKYVILDHHQCFCHMKDFLSEALQRSESEAFIKTKLTQVKSRFMLPLICAAAEHNLWFLQFSENPEQLELGARLAKDLFRWFKSTALYNSLGFSLTMVPIFFMDLHDPIRKISNAVDPFDLKKVSNLVAAAFLQESRTEDAFNILERVVDHLISELRRTFTARETVELIRQVFRTAPMIIPDRKKAAFELRLETKLTTFLNPFVLAPMPLPLRRPAGPRRRPPSRAPREIGF